MADATYPNNRSIRTWFDEQIALLNGRWHKLTLNALMAVVLLHWVEHIVQAYQVYGMHWHRTDAHGALGLVQPWLVKTEWLHYGFALVMLVGMALLRSAFVGRARFWWTVALAIQIWHHFEHLLLLIQALLGTPFFGAAVPTSIMQLAFPRMELHLFYNAVVFVPMVIAMFYHRYPSAQEARRMRCSCGVTHRQPADMLV